MEKYPVKEAVRPVKSLFKTRQDRYLDSPPIMTNEETEILEFYRDGVSIKELSENYGHSVYMLKKFLANEPKLQPVGYIWRSLYPSNKNLNLI